MRNRIALVVSAVLVLGLLVGLTTSAAAGAGGSGNTGAKKKKKKKVCPAGTHKVTVKKKNGKKKKKCVADPVAPAPGPTTLAISPTTFTFPDTEHGDSSTPQAFTVTNTGGAPSGVPAASITETNNPIPGDPPGFAISASTCAAVLPAGGSCTVSVRFQPTSNATGQPYTSVLHVVASPGSDAQASLAGTGV
jgi:hypothetical protein